MKTKTTTKAMKYKVLKHIDSDLTKREFNQLLWDIQKEVRTVLNKSIQHEWVQLCSDIDYKEEHGVYPKSKNNVYDKVKQYGEISYSSIIGEAVRTANQKFKSSKKDIMSGDKSILNFKKNQPIGIKAVDINVFKDEEGYKTTISLLNRDKSKELGMKTGKFTLLLDCGKGNNSAKSIMNKTIEQEYKLNACKLEYIKNNWYLVMTYTHEIDDSIKLDSNRILGIDLGIKYVAYASVYDLSTDSYDWVKNNYIEGGEIEQFRKQIEARRLSMLKQSKHCGEGRKGHGRATLLKPTDKLQDKVDNFRNTCNHRYSRYIVDMAVKNNCGKIVMENLSGVGELSHFLKQWSYYELQSMVQYKAKEFNIEVEFIDPKYTSQRCNKCGCIDKENRQTQEQFVCTTCGHKDNADRNASKNIAYPDIENIIKEQIYTQYGK